MESKCIKFNLVLHRDQFEATYLRKLILFRIMKWKLDAQLTSHGLTFGAVLTDNRIEI